MTHIIACKKDDLVTFTRELYMLDFFLGLVALIIGLFFGNFGTSFYYRIATGTPITGLECWRGTPPHCSTCKHPLRFYEYLPIFNWFSVRGNRCNYCGASIDPIYHIFELGTGAMATLAYFTIGFSGRYIFVLMLSLLALVSGFLFYRKIPLPTSLIILLGALGLLENLLYHTNVFSHLVAIILFAILLLIRPVHDASHHPKSLDVAYISAELACIVGIWLPLYITIPLLVLVYCLHIQHPSFYRYLYFITLLPTWLFVIL